MSSPAAATDIDDTHAWHRLAFSTLLAAVGGAGMWAVVVVLPAVQAEFAVERGPPRCPIPRRCWDSRPATC